MVILFYFVFVFIFLLFFLNLNHLRIFGLFYFSFYFVLCFFFILVFNKSIFFYQLFFDFFDFNFFNMHFFLGYDALAIFLILLSVFLLIYCLFIYWFLKYRIIFYLFCLFLSLVFFINVFFSLDLFFFYAFFEAVVIPMFFLIGIWGSRERKIYASYQFFLYTLLGSILVLICFLTFYIHNGSAFFDLMFYSKFLKFKEFLCWSFLFFGFSVKIPILPFHIWLPEAHVEAPTPGSVILAGILLKLGVYAMFRFLIGPLETILHELFFFVFVISLFGLSYSSLVAFNQFDVKKIIAYSSIAHMNFVLFGIFSQIIMGMLGAFTMVLSHALTSGALFLGIGVLYDRYKTRLMFYYGGLVNFMPVFSVIFFILILSNFGFPGTFNFVGEFLILLGGFWSSHSIIFMTVLGIFLTLVYSLSFFNRVFFSSVTVFFLRFYCDCTRLEFFIFSFFVFLLLFFGFFPNFILNYFIFFACRMQFFFSC